MHNINICDNTAFQRVELTDVINDKSVAVHRVYSYRMARPFMQMVVLYNVILQLLIQVDGAPYSARDFVSLFANPVKDFIKLFAQANNPKSAAVRDSGSDFDGKTDEKMIEAPDNDAVKCKDGTVKDRYGFCRRLVVID